MLVTVDDIPLPWPHAAMTAGEILERVGYPAVSTRLFEISADGGFLEHAAGDVVHLHDGQAFITINRASSCLAG